MNSQMERAQEALFGGAQQQTLDVKFFLGTRRDITPEQLAEQINRSARQIKEGVARPRDCIDGTLTQTAL